MYTDCTRDWDQHIPHTNYITDNNGDYHHIKIAWFYITGTNKATVITRFIYIMSFSCEFAIIQHLHMPTLCARLISASKGVYAGMNGHHHHIILWLPASHHPLIRMMHWSTRFT